MSKLQLLTEKKAFWMPILLMLAGIYLSGITYFNTDLSRIPGDFGDARFNNYILEHGHLFLTGKLDSYWDAHFMYPYKNVIGLSDNLLGSLPFYSVFRLLHFDRETSFQLWILTIFILNFWGCYWALKKLCNNTFLAASFAYVYAFGLYNHGQIFHVQVLPRFIAPLIFYWFLQFIETKRNRYFLLASLGTVYQFYCAIYLGFFVLYFLIFFFLASLILNKSLPFALDKKHIKGYLLTILICILLIIPLIFPYYLTSEKVGMRSFEYSLNSLPRLRSYFFTSPASKLWNFLYPLSAFKFTAWFNHFLFPGIIPWIGVALSPLVLFLIKVKNLEYHRIKLMFITFILSFIFCINFNNHTLYKIIYLLPGFSSMRSIDRIINIQIIFFLFLSVLSFKLLLKNKNIKSFVLILLPFAVITDNLFKPEPHKSISKLESQADINYYKNIISKNYNKENEAIAFFSINTAITSLEYRNYTSVTNTLGIMLACQDLGIACVNGYSGFNPGSYEHFFMNPDSANLLSWCNDNNYALNKIQIINDFETGGFNLDTVQIIASDSNYVCLDKNYNNIFVANRKEPQSWETFKMLSFSSGRKLIVSLDNYFLKVDPFNKTVIGYPNFLLYSDLIVTENINNSPYKYIKIYDYYVTVNPINQVLTISDNNNNGISQFLIRKKEMQ